MNVYVKGHLMKFFVITFLLLFTITAVLQADSHPPSDTKALTAVLSTAVKKFLEPHNLFPGKTVSLTFSPLCAPSRRSRESAEAVLTEFGCAITDTGYKADFILDIAITDARIIIKPHKNGFSRTVFMKVYLKCLDSSREVILASGYEEKYEDEIPEQFLQNTNDSEHFCENSMRITVERNRGRARLISFTIITGILVYFASK